MTIARHHCISSRHANRDAARTDAARFDMRPALAMLPGILLAGAIAAAALITHHIPVMATFSPIILAIVIGMAFHNIVGTPSIAKPGIAFSLRRLLRVAVILLGFGKHGDRTKQRDASDNERRVSMSSIRCR